MALPIHEFNLKTLDAADMSSNITGDVINIQNVKGYAVQFIWTGASPVGELDIEASNDGETFTSILDSTLEVAANSGDYLVNVENALYGYIRVVYTSTSGSGDLTCFVNGQRA